MKNGNWKFTLITILAIAFLAFGGKIANANEFALPLRDCANDAPCYVTAYYNHGDNGNDVDWNNGPRTYHRGSYYHKGTDIGTGGQHRVIVAAKGGRVVEVVKTCVEDNCPYVSRPENLRNGCCLCSDNRTRNGLGNYIKIEHDNGTFALYGHMKTNSAMVSVGATVTCGQELGLVGSSGCSTGRHLHFEPRVNSVAVDPFHGENNEAPSLWVNQGEYDPTAGWDYIPEQLPGTECAIPPPPACNAPVLVMPAQNETGVKRTATLVWYLTRCGTELADAFRVQVNTSSTFPSECENNQQECTRQIVLNAATNDLALQVPEDTLDFDTMYFWRVRAGHTRGAGGSWSTTRQFTTEKRLLACVPSLDYEVCNNFDDNCDGDIDEGLTRSCTNECGNRGTETCTWGVWSACNAQTCPAPPTCTPSAEVCNNKDDDCDQAVDENLTRTCTNECGHTGTQSCSRGIWSGCNAQSCPPPCTPYQETCNNRDDDCDGSVDESVTQSCSNSCGHTGTQYCTRGTWSACNAQTCPPTCTPSTCISLGKQCGSWSNGCGSTLNCGGCTSPATCNSSGQCVTPPPTCGGANQPCCAGNSCNAPYLCSSSGCVMSCGGYNRPCCLPGSTCSISGERSACFPDNGGTCFSCGATWQLCCPGGSCTSVREGIGIYCKSETGTCWPCGGEGHECCRSGTPCGAGLYCDQSTNHCSR